MNDNYSGYYNPSKLSKDHTNATEIGLMSLRSDRFSRNHRLQIAAKNVNRRPIAFGASGEHVEIIQQTLLDAADLENEPAFSLPIYHRDGIFGRETAAAVRAWEMRFLLNTVDSGIAGEEVLTSMDDYCLRHDLGPIAPKRQQLNLSIDVTGPFKFVSQFNTWMCWAATAAMMMSFRESGKPFNETEAAEKADAQEQEDKQQTVDPTYKFMVEHNMGLLPTRMPSFVQSCRLIAEVNRNPTIPEWTAMLQRHGLLVVIRESPGGSDTTHGVILRGMRGDGSPTGTFMIIADPAGGERDELTFEKFIKPCEEVEEKMPRPQIWHL
jgi:peptidoglycan hydrolase-like protein with peptidoglycan-binding domain